QLVKQSITSKFSIKKKPFTITHFLLTSRSGFKHSLHYCADKRVVLTKPLASRIPNLVDPLPSLNGINDTVSYAGYLASAYLDSHVNQERTGFHIYEETDALFNQQPSISEIDDEALKSTAEYLAPYIEPVRQQKMTQIGEYVE